MTHDRLERAACQRFKEAMDDDFGTPEAVAVLFELATDQQREKRSRRSSRRSAACSACCSASRGIPAGRRRDAGGGSPKPIAAREAARKRKDYAEADRIRKELLEKASCSRTSRAGPPGAESKG